MTDAVQDAAAGRQWPADHVERRPVAELVPYARNARTHSDAQVQQLAASIEQWGWTMPVLVDEAGVIIAGHGRVLAAQRLGITAVPVMVARGWTDEQRRAYVLADNQLAINAGWDAELLGAELQALDAADFDLPVLGFGDAELAGLLPSPEEAEAPADDRNGEADRVPDLQKDAVTQRGDVWLLGRHRIMCGDSTIAADVGRVTAGDVDLVCTDPPYCSGGFQEAGKSAGSVGTAAPHKMVANDVLSSRGYMKLLKAAFSAFGAPYLYAFTDWRMWVHLFDVAEASGFGVRSMIVWDKGTPGMGRGWRAQHELIMWACKRRPPFDKHAAGRGNVIQAKRSGNVHHTTEKPVDLVVALLENTPFAQVVADPFAGSGTTMIACEKLGREFRGMEMDPLYVDVAVRRWQEFTSRDAALEGDGRTFDEVAESRRAEGAVDAPA